MAKKARTSKAKDPMVSKRVKALSELQSDLGADYKGNLESIKSLMGESFTGIDTSLVTVSKAISQLVETIKSGDDEEVAADVYALLSVGTSYLVEVMANDDDSEDEDEEDEEDSEGVPDDIEPVKKETKTPKKEVTLDGDAVVEESAPLTLEEELNEYTNKELKEVVLELGLSAGKKPNKSVLVTTILEAGEEVVYRTLDTLFSGDDE